MGSKWLIGNQVVQVVAFGCAVAIAVKLVRHHSSNRTSTSTSTSSTGTRSTSSATAITHVNHHNSHGCHRLFGLLVLFFGYLTLWSLCRAVLGTMALINDQLEETLDQSTSVHSFDWSQRSSSQVLVVVVCVVRNVAAVATCLWCLAMARELFGVAKESAHQQITGDAAGNQKSTMALGYLVGVHALVALYACILVAIVASDKHHRICVLDQSIVVLVIQSITALYVILARMWVLVFHDSAKHSALPAVYFRVRSLVVVFDVLALQYQVLALVIVHKTNRFAHFDSVDELVLRVSSLIFHLAGIMLAVMMTCSQEWLVSVFGRFMPKEYVETFLTSSDFVSCAKCLHAPQVNPVLVVTAIEAFKELQEFVAHHGDERSFRSSLALHNEILHFLLMKHHGYEISNVDGGFKMAFHDIQHAVEFCLDAQVELLRAQWPKELETCGVDKVTRVRVAFKTIFRGLRVRMGIHDAKENAEGALEIVVDPITGRKRYVGASDVIASKASEMAHGGQIVVTSRVARWVAVNHSKLVQSRRNYHTEFVGNYYLTSVFEPIEVHQLVIRGLEARVESFDHEHPRKLSSCIEVNVIIEDDDDDDGSCFV